MMSSLYLKSRRSAGELAIRIHSLLDQSLRDVMTPELSKQIRRSIQSLMIHLAVSSIFDDEPEECIRWLVLAQNSAAETMDHLDSLYREYPLINEKLYQELHDELDRICTQLYLCISQKDEVSGIRLVSAPGIA